MVETLTQPEMEAFLQQHYIGHLAVSDAGHRPYVVPVTYLFDPASHAIISYTAEGRKIDILRENPQVCLAVTEVQKLTRWRSVVIDGTFEELKDMEAMKGIQLLITRLQRVINEEGHQQVEFISDMARAKPDYPKVIYRINITEMNGRYEEPEL